MNSNQIFHEHCPKCGIINRLTSAPNYEKLAVCGKCGTPLAANLNVAQKKPQPKTDEKNGLGLLGNFALVFGTFSALRIAFHFIPDNNLKIIITILAALVFILTETFRNAFLEVMIIIFIGVIGAFIISHFQEIKSGKLEWRAAAQTILHTYAGLNPFQILKKSYSTDTYIKYLNAVDPRDVVINNLASDIIKNCKEGDHVCEADEIGKYVSTSIRYTSDPDTKEDYIKNPKQTLNSKAGDCEDKTILASSLLESVGIPALFAFEDRHVYPLACFDQIVPSLLGPYIKTKTAYCYTLEPTAHGSGLGVQKDFKNLKSLYDVRSKKPFDLKSLIDQKNNSY